MRNWAPLTIRPVMYMYMYYHMSVVSHGIVSFLAIGVERSGRTEQPAEGGEAPLENEKKYSSGIFRHHVHVGIPTT